MYFTRTTVLCCVLFKYSQVPKFCEIPGHLPYLVMRHSVVVEVAGGREALPADAALVRLLAAVDPPANLCNSQLSDYSHLRKILFELRRSSIPPLHPFKVLGYRVRKRMYS